MKKFALRSVVARDDGIAAALLDTEGRETPVLRGEGDGATPLIWMSRIFCLFDAVGALAIWAAAFTFDPQAIWGLDVAAPYSVPSTLWDLVALALIRTVCVLSMVAHRRTRLRGLRHVLATLLLVLSIIFGATKAVWAVHDSVHGEGGAAAPAGSTAAPTPSPSVSTVSPTWTRIALPAVGLLCSIAHLLALTLRECAVQAARVAAADKAIEGKRAREGAPNDAGGSGWRRLMRLALLALPESTWLVAGCVVLLLRLPFSLAMPHFVATTIGALAAVEHDMSSGVPGAGGWHSASIVHVRTSVTCLFAAGCVDALLDFWCVFLFGVCQQRVIRNLRCMVFDAVLAQEVAFFDTTSTGDITSRLTADTSAMASDLTWVFRFSLESSVRIGGIAAYMFVRSWQLALVTVIALPITAFVNYFYGKWLRSNATKVQDALSASNVVAHEVIGSIRTVFAFAQRAVESARYRGAISAYYDLNVRQTAMQAGYYMAVSTWLVQTCVQTAILAYGASLIARAPPILSSGALLAFMLYQSQLQSYCCQLLDSYTRLIMGAGAGAKVFDLIDRTPQRTPSRGIVPAAAAGPRRRVGRADGAGAGSAGGTGARAGGGTGTGDDSVGSGPPAIEFDRVSFAYPTRPDALVLDELSFSMRPGEMYALVGASGAGKSTAFHLLEQFYEASSGEVRVFGEDVRFVSTRWFHRTTALVGQEPTLFAGSVRGNILFALRDDDDPLVCETVAAMAAYDAGPGITEDTDFAAVPPTVTAPESRSAWRALQQRVEEAATVANAHGFIRELPSSYATQVGERGVQLSGGQRQRIAIARAIMGDPQLLLLDEATSNLDSDSERLVQEALERVMVGRTTLVIAHRLSTIQGADAILVLENGALVERGTHAELLAREGGAYAFLAERQRFRV
jgi:ATP-binding cassette subfamily B (MDR/TAP) protein 9